MCARPLCVSQGTGGKESHSSHSSLRACPCPWLSSLPAPQTEPRSPLSGCDTLAARLHRRGWGPSHWKGPSPALHPGKVAPHALVLQGPPVPTPRLTEGRAAATGPRATHRGPEEEANGPALPPLLPLRAVPGASGVWARRGETGTHSLGRGGGHARKGPLRPVEGSPRTFVVMVPAPRVVVLEDLGRAPGVQDVVHLVLLPPGQRLAHDLSGLVDVEVPGAQEAENVLVFGDLRENDVSKQRAERPGGEPLPRQYDSELSLLVESGLRYPV